MLYFNFYSFATYTLTWEITSVFHQYFLVLDEPRNPCGKLLFHSVMYGNILLGFTGWRFDVRVTSNSPRVLINCDIFGDDDVHTLAEPHVHQEGYTDFLIFRFIVFCFLHFFSFYCFILKFVSSICYCITAGNLISSSTLREQRCRYYIWCLWVPTHIRCEKLNRLYAWQLSRDYF